MFSIIEPHFDKNIHDLVWYYLKIRGINVIKKFSEMTEKDKTKFMENEQVREKLVSMFGLVYLN